MKAIFKMSFFFSNKRDHLKRSWELVKTNQKIKFYRRRKTKPNQNKNMAPMLWFKKKQKPHNVQAPVQEITGASSEPISVESVENYGQAD